LFSHRCTFGSVLSGEREAAQLTLSIEKTKLVIPFANPAPSRRTALAWRKSFARGQAIGVLTQAIAHSKITGIKLLR